MVAQSVPQTKHIFSITNALLALRLNTGMDKLAPTAQVDAQAVCQTLNAQHVLLVEICSMDNVFLAILINTGMEIHAKVALQAVVDAAKQQHDARHVDPQHCCHPIVV